MRLVSEKSENIKKLRFDVKCKRCGWTNRIYFNKRICKHCGYYVFKNEKEEFMYRLKERMKSELYKI